MSQLSDINRQIEEFMFKHLISDTGSITDSDIVTTSGMNYRYSFRDSPNDIHLVEFLNDVLCILEQVKIHCDESNAEDEIDIAKYTPGWTLDEDGRPVQIDNIDVGNMMDDMSLGD